MNANTQEHKRERQDRKPPEGTRPLVLPFAAIGADMLPVVGGKGANLGEMARAGFPVPGGFCVTTAAYELASGRAGLISIVDDLAEGGGGDIARLEEYAVAARTALAAVTIPEDVEAAVGEAYGSLVDDGPVVVAVAVRSSATAEDLPFASFAGQQDTYLNIVGLNAVLDAMRRCWASLWTDRAVSYRASNGIDQRSVRLAVVVQRMVDAKVAGVLFTANPLTGRRRQAVIDASPGLGEAVVSGAVNPDHFVVDTAGGRIVTRHLGDKRLRIQALPGGGTERVEMAAQSNLACLTDGQVLALAKLGAQVEAHYGAPQDIEWAIDGEGHLWLTQARPITTLYPLPASGVATLRASNENLRVYFSINVAQGVYRPFTPMGIATVRLMVGSVATSLGFPPLDPLAGPAFIVEAGNRLFFDLTNLLRSPAGRIMLPRIMGQMEARSSSVFLHLFSDPRLAPIPVPRRVVLRRVLRLLPRIRPVPLYIAQALLNPKAARARIARLEKRLRKLGRVPANASAAERLDAFERLYCDNMPPLMLNVIPLVGLVFGLPAMAGKLLGDLATADERQAVLRGLPYNPTTEMDLRLWKLATRIGKDSTLISLFRDTPPEALAQAYREGALPPLLQQELADFLRVYGHRGVAEIDMGLPRWSEDPTHILGALANYLQLKNPALAPAAQFRRGAREARAMVVELTQRAKKRGRLRGRLVGLLLRRIRSLSGLREVPKYDFVLLLAAGRRLLVPVGEELVRSGRLEIADDVLFIDLAEAREAVAGKDFRAVVRERRAVYERELARRHIPRILLSDGTEPEREVATPAAGTGEALKGTPASAGVATGKARVILDPVGARLEPGEILVAPSTDPGWTPLFLTAAGLVMEMGGPMSHGAVVAREYGIPAVVGVAGATESVTTGMQITVDGSGGTVTLTSDQ